MKRPEPFRDLDWDSKRTRELGDRTVDVWSELVERLPSLPVARGKRVAEVRDRVAFEPPEDPMPLDDLVAYVREVVFENSTYPGHPAFMAYIMGPGTVPGAAADLVAAALNQNLGAWRASPAPTEIELHVTRWFAERFGLPDGAGGIFTSGGAMAGFVGLKVARDRKAGWDIRTEGILGGPPLTLYASEEVHGINARAADVLGIGKDGVRLLPADEAFRLRVETLRQAIAADREAGRRPFAVVASAGTVATGAIDPLPEIADVCRDEDLWLHVDAAYGGPAVLAPELRPRLAGIERADSIAFDAHKWLYTPHSGGITLVRDFDHLSESFSIDAAYTREDKERTGTGVDFMELGPQFSRSFYGFKVWLSLLAYGTRAYATRIAHDAELARYLAAEAERRPDFEPMAPVTLSIACFRYVPPDLPDGEGREEYLDALNERLVPEIQLDGRAFCSNAVLRGRYVLRACIVNFRTEADEVDLLLDVASELGAKLDAEMRPTALLA